MTDTSLAVQDGQKEIVSAGHWAGLDEERKALLRDTLCQGATDAEFEMAVAVCNRLQLDPFAKQIWFVKRWDSKVRREVMASQISIDGFRLIAERTNKYRGQTEPEWCGSDGVWRGSWIANHPPAAARCGVYRSDFEHPVYAVARFQSYVQVTRDGTPNAMWRKMPEVMLHKCAESLALRKAFPNELCGVYSADEMGQADNEVDYHGPVPAKPAPAKPQAALPGPVSFEMQQFEAKIKTVQTEAQLTELAPMAANLPRADMPAARKLWKETAAQLNRDKQKNGQREPIREEGTPKPDQPPHDPLTGEIFDVEDGPDSQPSETSQTETNGDGSPPENQSDFGFGSSER